MDKITVKCEICAFFELTCPTSGYGECRIEHPIAGEGWPSVRKSDWCGYFEESRSETDNG